MPLRVLRLVVFETAVSLAFLLRFASFAINGIETKIAEEFSLILYRSAENNAVTNESQTDARQETAAQTDRQTDHAVTFQNFSTGQRESSESHSTKRSRFRICQMVRN